jgi:hypothetical protein
VSVAAAQAVAKPVATHHAATTPTKPAKPAKVAFAANGSVTAVISSDATITVAVKSGTKDVKGQTISISVPTTSRIVVNGARKNIADLGVGYRITVTGTHVGSLYTAARVEAVGVRAQPTPSASVTASPGPTSSADPTASASPAVTENPTV